MLEETYDLGLDDVCVLSVAENFRAHIWIVLRPSNRDVGWAVGVQG